MQWFNLTFGDPAHDLAIDEALLDWCEATESTGVLRFWESPEYFVVLGYANHQAREVNLAECKQRGIPILRRCSGGGTVVQGPGCLNYTLVLPEDMHVALSSISDSNRYIMDRQRQAVENALGSSIEVQGHTDLIWQGRKFSGNAQRRRRRHLLFHGCFLLNFDLQMIHDILNMPSSMPDYRQARSHADFLTNLPVNEVNLKAAIRNVWSADQPMDPPPLEMVEKLVSERYGLPEWHSKY